MDEGPTSGDSPTVAIFPGERRRDRGVRAGDGCRRPFCGRRSTAARRVDGARASPGAPLGRHTPLNPLGLEPFNLFVFISGTFTRFTDEELLDRYPSRDQYVERVMRAADHLAGRGYITNPDRRALIVTAEHEPLPEGLQCPQ
jgi:hypothetical protein